MARLTFPGLGRPVLASWAAHVTHREALDGSILPGAELTGCIWVGTPAPSSFGPSSLSTVVTMVTALNSVPWDRRFELCLLFIELLQARSYSVPTSPTCVHPFASL